MKTTQQLKSDIFHQVQASGIFKQVQSKLKAQVLNIVQKQHNPSRPNPLNFQYEHPLLNKLRKYQMTSMCLDLIQQFLESFKFKYTLSVFKKEINRDLNINREILKNQFDRVYGSGDWGNANGNASKGQAVLLSLVKHVICDGAGVGSNNNFVPRQNNFINQQQQQQYQQQQQPNFLRQTAASNNSSSSDNSFSNNNQLQSQSQSQNTSGFSSSSSANINNSSRSGDSNNNSTSQQQQSSYYSSNVSNDNKNDSKNKSSSSSQQQQSSSFSKNNQQSSSSVQASSAITPPSQPTIVEEKPPSTSPSPTTKKGSNKKVTPVVEKPPEKATDLMGQLMGKFKTKDTSKNRQEQKKAKIFEQKRAFSQEKVKKQVDQKEQGINKIRGFSTGKMANNSFMNKFLKQQSPQKNQSYVDQQIDEFQQSKDSTKKNPLYSSTESGFDKSGAFYDQSVDSYAIQDFEYIEKAKKLSAKK